MSLNSVLREARACTVCQSALPLGARPVLQAAPGARLLIVGQAPGHKVHATGLPWNDASGDRLRDWLQIDRAVFYDANRVALVPMGFCYPGATQAGGDRPPRRECAPLWHARLLGHLPEVRCTLLVGQYAQRHYLRAARKTTLTETVRAFAEYGPRFSAAASELAEHRMDATERVVRGAGAPGFARSRATVGIARQPASHCWRSLSGRYFSITVSSRSTDTFSIVATCRFCASVGGPFGQRGR